MRMKILLTGTAIALGATVAATPADAAVCEIVANTPYGTATLAGDLACGGNAAGVGTAFATAIGDTSNAVGDGATAVGDDANATGVGATAVGGDVAGNIGAQATADETTAIGAGTSASVLGATAVGFGAAASNNSAVAIGQNAVSSGNAAVAIGGAIVPGNAAAATGDFSVAIGFQAIGGGVSSVAIGDGAVADGDGSVALGAGASNATFVNSVALGAGSTNTADDQVAVGGRTISGVNAGLLSATSTEAVNGSQLFATNNNITNLQNDVADLQAQDIVLANRIHRTDRRASGGTAVAIAMGGNMFLPDKTFNLTGNVGLYRSQVAAAVNIGALVGSGAAFNAGVGSGFNHNGRFGARAGFTFGW